MGCLRGRVAQSFPHAGSSRVEALPLGCAVGAECGLAGHWRRRFILPFEQLLPAHGGKLLQALPSLLPGAKELSGGAAARGLQGAHVAAMDDHVALPLAWLRREHGVDLQLAPVVDPPDPERDVPEGPHREGREATEVLIVVRVRGVVAVHPEFRLLGRDPGRGVGQGRHCGGGFVPELLPDFSGQLPHGLNAGLGFSLP